MTVRSQIDRRTMLAGIALAPAMMAGGCSHAGEALSIYSTLPRKITDEIGDGLREATGIETRFWRASRNAVIQRVSIEAERQETGFDVLELESSYLEILSRRFGLFAALGDRLDTLDPQQNFAVSRVRATALGWNTNLLKGAAAPRGYADLLDPALRHRIVIVANAVPWFFAMHRALGETRAAQFFDALARQGVRASQGHSLTAELVASGEYAVSPTLYDYKLAEMKSAGDPIDFALPNPLLVEESAWAVNAASTRQMEARKFLQFAQRKAQQFYRRVGMVAGGAEEFYQTYPTSRGAKMDADGLHSPEMLARWSQLMDDFLKRARAY